ncbi:hypothetical protein Ptr902_04261 [Pyrenophora tritici-repentis]|nr:hypothetical protein Ptr902_04261 [Pyrenophora tritici-repentis]
MADALASLAQECDMITQENQLQSPFLRLPAELRKRIYDLACANEVVHVYNPISLPRVPYNLIYLLQICRQIRYEAKTIFYSTCTFTIYCKIVDSNQGSGHAGGKNVGDIVKIGCGIWSWHKALITSIELDNAAVKHICCTVTAWKITLACKQAAEARANAQSGEMFHGQPFNRGAQDNLLYAEGFVTLQKIHVYHHWHISSLADKKAATTEVLRVGFWQA